MKLTELVGPMAVIVAGITAVGLLLWAVDRYLQYLAKRPAKPTSSAQHREDGRDA